MSDNVSAGPGAPRAGGHPGIPPGQVHRGHGLCIIVADRGNVWVGDVTEGPMPGWTQIDGARVVRRWGTSKGLNQLANEGPRTGTVLDEAATVKVATKAIIALIPCEAAKWSA